MVNKSGLLNTLRSYETTSRCPVLSCTSLTLGDDLVHFPTFLAKYLESSLFCYIFATWKVEPSRATMWGTVAWLRSFCRDDEQFDLAAWFHSQHNRSFSFWLRSVYFFIFGQCKFHRIFHPCCRNEIHKFYMLSPHLHLVVRMNDKLRLTIGIDKTFAVVV